MRTAPDITGMHVVTCSFEAAGFDVELMRGGTSLYVWNLSRRMAKRGHRVSVVTPAHGRIGYLRDRYDLDQLDYRYEYDLPLVLDERVWKGHERVPDPRLSTTAYRLRREGVDFYFLANEYLDLLPRRLYPGRTAEGTDLSYFKPLVFQVDAVRFIDHRFGDQDTLVHAHEPYYTYLVSTAFARRRDKPVVTTVMSNMPINQKVYRPQVEKALELIGADVDLAGYVDPPELEAPAVASLRETLPTTLSALGPTGDYVPFFAMVADHSVLIDFMSDGQRSFYSTYQGTPFAAHLPTLAVGRAVTANRHRFFVGGCAIADEWIDGDPASVDRGEVLRGLGLRPELCTFYHSARYSPQQKGQLELIRAVERFLRAGHVANFIVRCAVGAGSAVTAGDTYFQEVAERFPDHLYLDWGMADARRQYAEAAAADFCVYPSKFELDTFMLAQGEAMACGAVPIATAQEGTRHFGHALRRHGPRATGLAVDRSFRDDDPRLVDQLVTRFHEAVHLVDSRPADYQRLSRNARAVASRYTWDRCADRHERAFAGILDGRRS
jgi:hypothetical protein